MSLEFDSDGNLYNEDDEDSLSDISFSDSVGSDVPVASDGDSDDADRPAVDAFTDVLTDVVIEDFEQHTGPTKLDSEYTILDYFMTIFTQAAIDLLVTETNRYVADCQLIKPDATWIDTTATEIKAYLGLNILFGIVDLPTIQDYWSSNPYLGKFNQPDNVTGHLLSLRLGGGGGGRGVSVQKCVHSLGRWG